MSQFDLAKLQLLLSPFPHMMSRYQEILLTILNLPARLRETSRFVSCMAKERQAKELDFRELNATVKSDRVFIYLVHLMSRSLVRLRSRAA